MGRFPANRLLKLSLRFTASRSLGPTFPPELHFQEETEALCLLVPPPSGSAPLLKVKKKKVCEKNVAVLP